MTNRRVNGGRVSGHSLLFEGAPFNEHGSRISQGRWPGVGGSGRGKCSCGELSEVLGSAYKRRAWHRAHKAEMAEMIANG